MNHPTRENLALLAFGFKDSREAAEARAHMAACAACAREYRACCGESAAVRAAFENAQPAPMFRKSSWWPFAAGLAASLSLGLLWGQFQGRAGVTPGHGDIGVPGMAPPPTVRRSVDSRTPGSGVIDVSHAGGATAGRPATPQGKLLVLRGSSPGADILKDENSGWEVRKGTAQISGDDGCVRFGGGRMELLGGAAEFDVRENVATALVLTGRAGLRLATGHEPLHPGDVVIAFETRCFLILRDEDLPSLRKLTAEKLHSLRRRAAALPDIATDTSTPEGVGAWLGKIRGEGRLAEVDREAGEVLARLWAQEAREAGVGAREIEASPLKERLIAGYLEGRGAGLRGRARVGWDHLVSQHADQWKWHLRKREKEDARWSPIERAWQVASVARGVEKYYSNCLGEEQRPIAAELDPIFREWRRGFAPVFRIVVGEGGPEKAVELLEHTHGPFDGVTREILLDQVRRCLDLNGDEAFSDEPSLRQVKLCEILLGTTDRLIRAAGLTAERATALLADYVKGDPQ